MPITKSAKKAAKRSVKLQERNNIFKNRMKISIKKASKALNKWEELKKEELNKIYKYVDKCAKVWVMKKKTAARKKSNISKLFNKTKKQ
jgi:small subunit ribosomal protein S20